MTISKDGLVDGSGGVLIKLVDRINTAMASVFNVLDNSTVTNQDLKDVHTNIEEIKKLTTLQIDGVVASDAVSSIITELATRVIALESA